MKDIYTNRNRRVSFHNLQSYRLALLPFLVNSMYKSLLPIFIAFNGVTDNGKQLKASRVQQVHKHALGLTL